MGSARCEGAVQDLFGVHVRGHPASSSPIIAAHDWMTNTFLYALRREGFPCERQPQSNALLGYRYTNELSKSFSSDFEFVVYQGEEELGGSDLSFSQIFDQGKPVVLNFWAGQCPPCRAEMPGFQEVYNQYQGDFILFTKLQ